MKNKKVIVLISTYNGEKYIEEQLNSIFNQSYKNIKIYVRDDGSTDGTLRILKKYEKEKKIKLINDNKNIGFIKSFFTLLKKCDKADYYAFCDQDDVWLDFKIEKAVKKLTEEDDNIPLLYSSNYDFYDSNMNFIGHAPYNNKIPSFDKALLECIAPGMTMVFNNTLKEIVIKNIPKECAYHDWWMYLVSSCFGKVIFDNTVTVKYRRHEKNVSESDTNILKKITRSIKSLSFSPIWHKLKKQLIEFEKIYIDDLSDNNRNKLHIFTNKGVVNYIKKVFYKQRFKDSLAEEIMIRIMIIICRI